MKACCGYVLQEQPRLTIKKFIRQPVSDILRRIYRFLFNTNCNVNNNSGTAKVSNVSIMTIIISINNISNNNYNIANDNENDSNNNCVLVKCFNFLLGERFTYNDTKEWKEFCKYKTKIGTFSDTSFLEITAALLNKQILFLLILVGNDSLFDRLKPDNTMSVNTDIIDNNDLAMS
ncbi:hypothetical protein PIROE2DRAFT_18622 [Piromyces sp. E2]|nr:hypothetical protein PIROE2DRAFT_18622 [Piromyces sp. E2]|eukprot:OUM56657.1 hypothetical protein PIROE2DRAFT_18622 [Piromyces sp. E2]